MTLQHRVTESEADMRIDKLLTQLQSEHSRSQIQSWINEDRVTVDRRVVKANYKCSQGELIEWSIPEVKPLDIEAEDIPLDIIYEDRDLLVVNKPKGMVVHPSAGHHSGTLVNALLYHCDDLSGINGIKRPGIVHRIDKDTSGLLVVAKHDQAHVFLSDQLAEQKVERKYAAIVEGVIDHEEGMIDAPIGRDPKDRKKMSVVDNGKRAITHFRVIQHYRQHTFIECQLETGRTHQIRVHMAYIQHPLVGDVTYGYRKTMDTAGQSLHAKALGFIHPSTKEWMSFNVEPPAYFQALLSQLDKMN